MSDRSLSDWRRWTRGRRSVGRSHGTGNFDINALLFDRQEGEVADEDDEHRCLGECEDSQIDEYCSMRATRMPIRNTRIGERAVPARKATRKA